MTDALSTVVIVLLAGAAVFALLIGVALITSHGRIWYRCLHCGDRFPDRPARDFHTRHCPANPRKDASR